LIYTASICMGV